MLNQSYQNSMQNSMQNEALKIAQVDSQSPNLDSQKGLGLTVPGQILVERVGSRLMGEKDMNNSTLKKYYKYQKSSLKTY